MWRACGLILFVTFLFVLPVSLRSEPQPTNAGRRDAEDSQDARVGKKHWSSKPTLLPGSELIAFHFIRFDTDAGRKNAKVFLIAVHPHKSGQPQGAGLDSRIFGNGFEIEADAGFRPDFEVDKKYVKEIPHPTLKSYEVDLGSVKYRVVTSAK